MSIDRIRNLLRDLDNELGRVEEEISDLEDERDELSDKEDSSDLINELENLSLKWYRESVKDPTCFAQYYAEQLDTIVKKYQ